MNHKYDVILFEQIDHLKVSAHCALSLDQDLLILKALGKRCSSMIHHEFGFFTANAMLRTFCPVPVIPPELVGHRLSMHEIQLHVNLKGALTLNAERDHIYSR